MDEASIVVKIIYWFVSAVVFLAWCGYVVFEIVNEGKDEEGKNGHLLIILVVAKQLALLSLFSLIGHAIGKALKVF